MEHLATLDHHPPARLPTTAVRGGARRRRGGAPGPAGVPAVRAGRRGHGRL